MIAQFKSQSGSAWLCAVLAISLATACTSNESNTHFAAATESKSSSADEIVPPKNPDGFSGAIGNVVKFSGNEVEINTATSPWSSN
jgi:hypothetical protein